MSTYFYHRATGTRLPDDPCSPGFLVAYADAEKIAPKGRGTAAGLIRQYLGSLKFERMRDSTQREYRRILITLEAEFGTMPIGAQASPKVRGVFLAYQEKIGREHPREADNRLSNLLATFSHAAARGEIRENPIKGFERIYDSDRSHFIWPEAEITSFMKVAPVELQRAMILALHTGQRYGDLVRLRWADYNGESVSLRQSKTSIRVFVRCSEALKVMLDHTPRTGPYVLTRADGRPWHTERDDKALSKAWRGTAAAARVEGLAFHDLRGTAVTLLSEASATPQQVAAITGHTLQSVHRIFERYLVRTPALAAAAILAFENAPSTIFANRLRTAAAGALPEGDKHE